MFSLHDFVLKTIKGMIGQEPDYKVMKYSLGWYDKEILTDEDMAEIQADIEAQYPEPEPLPTEPTEEVLETVVD